MTDLVTAAEAQMLAKYRAELRGLLDTFSPADLELPEVLALIAVVAPVAARAGRQGSPSPIGPKLSIVAGESDAD
ncbi:MAG: hypothetical protein ACPGVG_13945 [Mycobacterium sp.]